MELEALHLSDQREQPAYALLLKAYQYASDAESDPWQFAICIDELKGLGLHDVDLYWLLNRSYATHAVETTIPGDRQRNFRVLETRIVAADTHYSLTREGYAALGRSLPTHLPPSTPNDAVVQDLERNLASEESSGPVLPVWDDGQRMLRFRGVTVKQFRVPAPNQERILAAFQEEGWPPGIDDPLPPTDEQDPIRRLQATIKSLNRSQQKALIRFRGNGNGDRICWDVAE